MWSDLLFALRGMRKNPGFTFTAVLTLALAIGATTAIFTLLNAVALRPLPYGDAARLVWVTQLLTINNTDEIIVTPDYLDWRRLNRSFEHLAAYFTLPRNLTGLAEPLQVNAARASADLLPALGVQPWKGRNFRRDEDPKGHDAVAILSYGLWERAFGSDPAIVGRALTLDGERREVIGILPADFVFPGEENVDLITPLGKDEAGEMARSDGGVSIVRNVIGRLKPGVTMQTAYAELSVIQAGLPNMIGNLRYNANIKMLPLQKHLLGDVQSAAWLLMGATFLLLLIACANTTNLLLSQAARRQHEMAVRSALGGSRRRLIAQLLVESLTLAGLASAGGLAIAYAARGVLLALIPQHLPGIGTLPLSMPVLAFAIGLAVLTTLLFGTVPALRLTGGGIESHLKQGGTGKGSAAHGARVLATLAAGEIALSLVLLIGAGLLLESFYRMRFGHLGFQTERLVVARMKPDPALAAKPGGQMAFFEDLLSTVRAIPGVEAATLTEASEIPPGQGHATNTFWIDRDPRPPIGSLPAARRQPVSSDYFTLMHIPLRAGRWFDRSDGPDAPRVVMVNEALVHRVFADRNPLDRKISELGPSGILEAIVGVVGDVKTSGLAIPPEPTIYYPVAQVVGVNPNTRAVGLYAAGLVIRTAIDPGVVASELRRRVAILAPNQPVNGIQTMEQRLTESVARPRFVSALLSAFAGLALLLGLVGVYGVMGCSVRWRWRELAIRHALGAQPAQLRALLLRQGAWIVIAGLALGIAGATAATRLLRGFLHQTNAVDPATYAAAALLIAAAAMLACWIPARRAASVDPAEVLRAE